MTATSTLANYIVSAKLEDFPDEVVLQAKHLIQDATGCALGGAQPASMALAESTKASGKTLITAIALAHEIASRIGMSLGEVMGLVAAFLGLQLVPVRSWDSTPKRWVTPLA